jgi:hypothetical protein
MPWYPSAGCVKMGNLPDAAQSNLPPSIMMPPMELPCPPIHFVAEWTVGDVSTSLMSLF